MRTAHLRQDLFDIMTVQSPPPPAAAQGTGLAPGPGLGQNRDDLMGDDGQGLGQEWAGGGQDNDHDQPRTGR